MDNLLNQYSAMFTSIRTAEESAVHSFPKELSFGMRLEIGRKYERILTHAKITYMALSFVKGGKQ